MPGNTKNEALEGGKGEEIESPLEPPDGAHPVSILVSAQ